MTDPVYNSSRWGKVRRVVLERDRWTCRICHEPIDPDAVPGSSGAASVDHVIPWRDGGAQYELSNLRAVHVRCNTWHRLHPTTRRTW